MSILGTEFIWYATRFKLFQVTSRLLVHNYISDFDFERTSRNFTVEYPYFEVQTATRSPSVMNSLHFHKSALLVRSVYQSNKGGTAEDHI